MQLTELDKYVSAMRSLGVRRLKSETFEIELADLPAAVEEWCPPPENDPHEVQTIYDMAFPNGRPRFR